MTPKALGFSLPPEWYPHDSCWMAWPRHEETWANIGFERARAAYAKVALAIAKTEKVNLIVSPKDLSSAKDLISSPQIKFHPCPINDSWTRDTGPTFLLNQNGQLAGIDWCHNAWGGNYSDFALDDALAKFIITETKARYFKADVVMEGGSFHVNGEGIILTTKQCLLNPNRNPNLSQTEIEEYLCNYLGGNKVIWLNEGLIEDETDGHIDEIACFVNPQTILCLITSDRDDPNYFILQENLEVLKSSKDSQAQTFEIITIEQPPATFLNNRRLTLSYVNFYLANGAIILPHFGYPKYDEQAYLTFKKIFPSYHIISLDALDIFAGGGGIHCITQQQPKSQ